MINNKSSKIISSLIWKFTERVGTQGLQFILQIFLARILMPSDYGSVAILLVFIAFADVLVLGGFGTALVQKKDTDDTDYSTVFYATLIVAFVLYIILYMSAPFVAAFYKAAELCLLLRCLAVILFPSAINSVQNAIILREMAFKKLMYCSLFSVFISGLIGLFMAYNGFGTWSLVVQKIFASILLSITMLIFIRWYPKFLFSFDRLKALFSYSWKLLLSMLLDTLGANIYSLVIGRISTPADLAYYQRGTQFPSIVNENINGTVYAVMFPVYSKKQGNLEEVKRIMRRAVLTTSFVYFPLMFGLAASAEPLVRILLTDKWMPCVIYLQLGCVACMFFPVQTANLQVINALGRSDIHLILQILKWILTMIVLFISSCYGVIGIAVGAAVLGFLRFFVNAIPNKKLIDYSYLEQIEDILPSFLLSGVMGFLLYILTYINFSSVLKLFFQFALGCVFYISLSYIFKFKGMQIILELFMKNSTMTSKARI